MVNVLFADNTKMNCYKCDKPGHFARDCKAGGAAPSRGGRGGARGGNSGGRSSKYNLKSCGIL